MKNTNTKCLSTLSNHEGKKNTFRKKSEIHRIYVELFKECQNSVMLHIKTGIPRKNICRIKRALEKDGLLWTIKDYCPLTGRLTQFLTTNLQTYQNLQLQSND